uniref:HTH CENPB-type domain-containing protein n=1 Tax=Biomphalaria glabrata TaxID=6526 RepID=A0A2C9LUB6_BIOGL
MSSKKSARGIRHHHDIELLKTAINAIRTKEMSLRKASKYYNIPLTTLHNKLQGTNPLISKKSLLTMDEENNLAKWLMELSNCGFGKSNNEVRETARAIIAARSNNSETQEQIELPTRQWLHRFYNRHPEVPSKTPKYLRKERVTVSPTVVELWFKKFQEYICSIDITIFSNPNRIFSADEMGFVFNTDSCIVEACKGSKCTYKIKSDTQTQVTVLACCNAVGQYIPPLLIYPYEETPTHNLLENFPEAVLQLSDNGLITSAFFFNWLKHIFIPSTNHLPKPILLLVDAHTSHTSFLEISPICSQNNIILYCLLPHASDIIQPLNQAFLGTFKPAWSDALRQHVANTGKGVNLESFAGVLKSVWNKVATPEIAADSFKAAGIFPLNPSKIFNSDKPVLVLREACSSERQEDDIQKSLCSSASEAPSDSSSASVQVPPESCTALVSYESFKSVPSNSSAHFVPPESFASSSPFDSPVPSKASASYFILTSSVVPQTSALLSSKSSTSLPEVSTSLVSPEEKHISQKKKYSLQQITALKEHSYFIFEEMTKTELSMFFSRLTNPENQIYSDSLREEKFQQFEALTLAVELSLYIYNRK